MFARSLSTIFKRNTNLQRSSKIHTCSILLNTSTENSTASDPQDVLHHAKLSSSWWDINNGPLRALHSLNEIRVPFIRDGLIYTNAVKPEYVKTSNVLKDLKILEVGCGGGILTENLGRLHANVTGLDLGDDVIRAAKEHLKTQSPKLTERINYKVESIEVHAKDQREIYDAVVLSEVLEHVDDKVSVLTACVDSLKPGGSFFITTPNQTFIFWLSGIVLAENVFNLVPKGTHKYEKLMSPIDTQRILDSLNCSTVFVNGFTYEFWRDSWTWIPSTMFSYALHAVKNS